MIKTRQKQTLRDRYYAECPVGRTLDILGDKWTLLVVRDMLFRNLSTYKELAGALPAIPSSILADRLHRLREAGLLTREPYQTNPVRYRYSLTAKGKDLEGLLVEMLRWGTKNILGEDGLAPPPGKATD